VANAIRLLLKDSQLGEIRVIHTPAL